MQVTSRTFRLIGDTHLLHYNAPKILNIPSSVLIPHASSCLESLHSALWISWSTISNISYIFYLFIKCTFHHFVLMETWLSPVDAASPAAFSSNGGFSPTTGLLLGLRGWRGILFAHCCFQTIPPCHFLFLFHFESVIIKPYYPLTLIH